MQTRRQMLLGAAGAAAFVTAAPRAVASTPTNAAEQQLNTMLEAFYQEVLDGSPELVTQLGLDKGARAAAKSQLSPASIEEMARDRAQTADQLARLKTVPRAQLTGMAAVNYDSVAFDLETRDAANRAFAYGWDGPGFPYALSQLSGAYQQIPDFLGSQHVIETKADADAYLARLEAFATVMDQEVALARRDAALGVIPPDFVIERALTQMNGLKTDPAASPLVTSVAERAQAKGIAGDYTGMAAKIYADKVVPALDRQIALMNEWAADAVHDAGCWRLPDGEAFYEHSLRAQTTTTLSAEEVHQMGLEQARELSARADLILKAEGYSQGSVGERIAALFKETRYHFPNTDAGKVELIESLNVMTEAMAKRLPEYFGVMPKAPVEVRRVPTFIEAGAPGGYYNQPTLDGSRPGIFWINLRDTAENPTWTLPTLTYHEALPGHHMQLALQQEADLPMIRRATFIAAYGEGWALYAEELAKEMGVYDDNPLGELGYLQAALFRAARLVVDTGIHAKRWSREKAIETMSSIDGSPISSSTTEIERYAVWPAQACSYMVGKLTWLRLRAKAQAALGDRFDLRAFHDAGLLSGAMPLTVLEDVVDGYIAGRRA